MVEITLWFMMLATPTYGGQATAVPFKEEFATSSKCEEGVREYISKAKAAGVANPKAFCMKQTVVKR